MNDDVVVEEANVDKELGQSFQSKSRLHSNSIEEADLEAGDDEAANPTHTITVLALRAPYRFAVLWLSYTTPSRKSVPMLTVMKRMRGAMIGPPVYIY